MSEVNIPLLRKCVEWAEAEAAKPDVECRWEQREYVTVPYIRAHNIASRRMGDVPWVYGNEWCERRDALASELEPECGTCYCIAGYVGQQLDERYARSATVDNRHVDSFARGALGLNSSQAEQLFDSDNSIEDVRRIAEEIAGERL